MHPLTVLGDPVRRALLEELTKGEGASGDLAARVGGAFGISHPAVSQHLKLLKEAGFAEARVEGRYRIYRLAPDGWEAASAWLERFRPFWEQKLDALGEELRRGRH